jgi:hypothetical protein
MDDPTPNTAALAKVQLLIVKTHLLELMKYAGQSVAHLDRGIELLD